MRVFLGRKGVTVDGLIFPARPCGHVYFCDGNKAFGISAFGMRELDL